MFKKIFVLALCAMMLMTCAIAEGITDIEEWTPPKPGSPESTGWTAPAPGDPLSIYGDFVLNINGTLYWVMNQMESGELLDYGWYDGLKDTGLDVFCGEPSDILPGPSCGFHGEDKEFVYDGISIYTNPMGENDHWYEAYITDGDWVTVRNIGIGASKEDVLAAYGNSYVSDEYDILTYNVSGDPEDVKSPCIMFTFEEDIVTCIDIYVPTNTQ